ncbi:MAG TPA: hypothetical protein VF612_10700 [Jatrophihabitans sp.]|jgi:hypothetical protein|uniref:hypothetical protein n=1 Tax=Jatrophihabitans sp. TaxID=1932789 RepID=UPI002EEF9D71
MRTLARATAAGIALATVILSNPVTASASGPMQVTGGSGCVSSYNNTFQCFDNFTGGTAPYTLSGSTSNTYATIRQMSLFTNADSYEIWVYGDCVPGKQTWVYINVQDSGGQTLSLRRTISCGGGSGV